MANIIFNPDKIEVLIISNSRNPLNLNLSFNNTNVALVNSHTLSGITFSKVGKWSEHIKNVCSEALKQLGALHRLKFLLSRTTLSTIYLTFILPI